MFGQLWASPPDRIRFMLRHYLNGVIIGWTIGLLLLRFDLSGLFSAQSVPLFGAFSLCVALMNPGVDDNP